MKKILCLLFIFFLFSATFARAETEKAFDMQATAEGIFVRNANLAVTEKIFADFGYNDYFICRTGNIRRFFLKICRQILTT